MPKNVDEKKHTKSAHKHCVRIEEATKERRKAHSEFVLINTSVIRKYATNYQL